MKVKNSASSDTHSFQSTRVYIEYIHRVLKAFVCKLGIMHYLLVIPCWYMAEWTQSQPLPNLQEAIQIPLSKEIAQGRIADNEGFRRGRKTYLFPKNKQGNSLLGLSVVYRPYPLYGYDVLRDSVFDAIRQFKISCPCFSRSYHTELISLADWNPRGAANIFALSSSVDTKIFSY